MTRQHPLGLLLTTFVAGAVSGLGVLVAAVWILPEQAVAALDLHGDGLDWKDPLAFAWIAANAAVLIKHVLPGIARG